MALTFAEKEGVVNDVVQIVVKNTLSRRAVKGTEHECLTPALAGPVFLAFATDEPGAAARLLRDAAKENDKIKVIGVALSGKLYGESDLDAVADLPTREEALSKWLAVMKEPIAKSIAVGLSIRT